MVVSIHNRNATSEVRYSYAINRFAHVIHFGGASFGNGCCPHFKADISGFHWIVGDFFVTFHVFLPLCDKGIIQWIFSTLEIVPGSQVANQGFSIKTGELFLTNRKRNNWDIFCFYARIG